MPRNKWFASAAIVGLTVTMSGCLDQTSTPTQHVWKMHDVDGRPTLLNQETGDYYVLKDGHLLEIPRMTQSDLGQKQLKISNLINLPLNVDAQMKFSDGDLKMLVSVNPEMSEQNPMLNEPTEEGLAAVQKLEAILKGDDEDYSMVALSLRDSLGINVTNVKLSQGDVQYMVNSDGNTSGLVFNVSERIEPHEYAAIASIDYYWNTK